VWPSTVWTWLFTLGVSMRARAVGYTRVSTLEQKRGGLSLDAQTEAIKNYCQMRGIELVRIVSDPGVSAEKPLMKRRGGALLLDALVRGEANAVIAVKLDRLFRNTRDALDNITKWDGSEVAVHLIDQGGASLDTRSAVGRLIITLLAAIAEMERNQISERVQAAMDIKKGRNERAGYVPFGFRVALGGRRLEPDEDEQRVLVALKRFHDDGFSLRKIARRLNDDGIKIRGRKWDQMKVKRLLDREADPDWRPQLKETVE
jgi:site-specific DNA recombinase